METRNIVILGAILFGGYWYYNKYMKKPITSNETKPTDVTKPQREIAPKPQTSSPNVKPSSETTIEATNTSVKSSFMDFDGEFELEKNVY